MSSIVAGSVALACIVTYGLVAFGARTIVQWMRTGSGGWRGLGGAPGTVPWFAGLLVSVGLAGLVAAPAAQTWWWSAATVSGWRLPVGVTTFASGLAITVVAQLWMGDAWRIGVRRDERTALCTRGPFAWVRNPIFTGMLVVAIAIALLVPWASVAAAMLWIGLALQVRRVEEPHLVAVHGAAYVDYAARTGRFVPGLGRGVASER